MRLQAKDINNCDAYLRATVNIPPNTSVTYEKFYNSNLSAIPLDGWGIVIPNVISGNVYCNDPLISAGSYVDLNFDWYDSVIVTYDLTTTIPTQSDNFEIANPNGINCGNWLLSTQYGTYCTAEWTYQNIGGVNYHVLNFY